MEPLSAKTLDEGQGAIMEKALFYMLHSSHTMKGLGFSFCGLSQTQPSHSFGPAMRDTYIIHVILSGEGELWSKGTRYRLHQNEGFVIRPDDSSSYRASATNPWTYLWMGFSGEDVEFYMRGLGLGPGRDAFRVRGALPFLNLIMQCYSYASGTVGDELKLHALAYDFLHLLSEQLMKESVPETAAPSTDVIRDAVEYMTEHYSEGIGVSEVAKALNTDRSYLSREFRLEVGMTVKDYLDQIRMTKACDLLSLSDISIAEVASRCGYGSTDLFFRKFKAAQQTTPTQYRQIRKTMNNGLNIDIDFFKAIFQH